MSEIQQRYQDVMCFLLLEHSSEMEGAGVAQSV
jgi:hypothetical protein